MAQNGSHSPYVRLAKRFARHPIGAPETDTFLEILKFYYELEEAHLASHMTWDMEPEDEIAERAGMSLDEAAPHLTAMSSKFFIRGIKRPDGERVFRLPLILPGLFELPFAVRQKSPDLDELGDLWEKYYAEAFGRHLHTGFQLSRAVPAIDSPKEQVVPYEDAVKIVESAPPAVIVPCPCRQSARNCDDPLNVCIVFGQEFYGGNPPGTPVMDPAHMVSSPRMRPAPADEVVEVLKLAEKAGLVHVTMNSQEDFWVMCNCCRHACHLLRGVTMLDIPHAVAPSSYWATVDEDLCNGCEACVPRCQVSAIKMGDGAVAEIDYELCLGCGICTSICAPQALRLEKRDESIFMPARDAVELMAMRGQSVSRPLPVHHHPVT
jgi:Pyruvate/2-oxoacid:ferredoxin oxidoreductase delta subunit